MTERRARRLGVGVLVTLAFLPALTAAPGRMPADSKLYLYLDPGRLLTDAAGSYDPRQFAGWVPHQHIGYLWPSGPWFWLFDLSGVPDWVAHRLWLGALLVGAGLGVRACARLLGLGHAAALAAAVVYQVSLYGLPYLSRTSVLLLPWAGLGWIVFFTIRATRRPGWTDPAAIALVVLTVGGVNATALAMIVPAPLLWIVHEVWRRAIGWREAALVAGRTTVLSIGVSLWWVAMLVVQARHGADVLPYSESLRDVSLTATSTEVWRGLGYWLFYVRDAFGPTTSASLRYLTSTPAIAISFLVPLVGLAGLVWTRWTHRRFAALLVVAGFALAVGVHPIDDRAPIVRLLPGGEGGLALALRSSTRALPVLTLGIALGAGALVAAAGDVVRGRRRAARPAVAALVGGLAVVNLPVLWTGGLVDPVLDRESDPPDAWWAAAAALDDRADGGRVLQLPGAEFGAYRWGYTVDQPLPGMTAVPLVTRDLLPLGSPAAMDLLFALDDRMQDGVLEPAAIGPVSRLLGVDTIWLSNDHAAERFRTARPGVVRDLVIDAPGVANVEGFGPPGIARPEVPYTDGRALGDPRVGEPAPSVELARLERPGRVVRAASAMVAISGSGEGIVDASAAGLVADGLALRPTASVADPTDLVAGSVALVVTDTNRARARHWRSSQDVHGLTEHTDPALDPLVVADGDQRLQVFDASATARPETYTLADQVGSVRATATGYGEPFAYLPEHRPVMAIDGDLATSWLVGEHGDPIGHRIVLLAERGIGHVDLRQPDPAGSRQITSIGVTVERGSERLELGPFTLDDRSVSGSGQRIDLDGSASRVEITILGVGGGRPGTAGAVAGVGFAEIGHGGGATTEVVRPPTDAIGAIRPHQPAAVVLTRWRVDPMDRWRDDPEPTLERSFPLTPGPSAEFHVAALPTVRIDARTSDRELAELFGWPVVASNRLTGSLRNAGVAAFDDDHTTAWITGFDAARGAQLVVDGATSDVDQVTIRQPIGGFSRVTALRVSGGSVEHTIDLRPDAAGAATVGLDPPLPAGRIVIEIVGVDARTTVDRRFGDIVELPAAISSIEFEGAPRVPPLGETDFVTECRAVALVAGQTVRATLGVRGDGWLDGGELAVEPCGASLRLGAGDQRVSTAPDLAPFQLDRLVLDAGARQAIATAAADAAVDGPTATVVSSSRSARTITVDACPDGCWLVLGEGYNAAWSASAAGRDLGEPIVVDGGFNGWWLAPGAADGPVELRWTAQRALTWSFVVAALAVSIALGLVVAGRRERREHPPSVVHVAPPRWTWAGEASARSSWPQAAFAVGLWGIAAGLLIALSWLPVGLLVGAIAVSARRVRLPELIACATLAALAAAVVVREWRSAPFPNGGWPAAFESFHRLGVFAAVALFVAAVLADDAQPDRTLVAGDQADAGPIVRDGAGADR